MSSKKVSVKSLATKTATASTTASTNKLKEELLKWICERHATNGPLDRKLLRERAMEIANSFGVVGFKCSEAWLTVFLKKHGFSPTLTNCNGPIFPDYKRWINLLRSLITQYRHRDLFIVDELVMFSDFLPWKKKFNREIGDVSQNNDKSRITSRSKRIGILLCCNSSGTEKLEPLISNCYTMEESRNETRRDPREFSCTSDETFALWLEKFNEEMSNGNRRVLLLLSRERIRSLHNWQCPSNVKLVFLPKDFPSHLRPLRGDVFHCVKMTYRSRYVNFARNYERSKEWTRKEIVESIFEAWKDVPRELVVSSFQRTTFREDESFLKIQCPRWNHLQTGMSFRKFVTFDDELCEKTNGPVFEDLNFLHCFNNEARYNLGKCRREMVEISDDPDEPLSEKKRKESREIVEENSKEILDEDPSMGSSLSVTPETRDTETSFGSLGYLQIVQNARSSDGINDYCAKKRRIFRDFVHFDEFDENLFENGDLRERNETSVIIGDNERVAHHFSDEAGPSGKINDDFRRETRANSDPYSRLNFDDEEPLPSEDRSKLKILDAIEIREDNDGEKIESTISTISLHLGNDHFPRIDDPTLSKRSRSEGNWSECYEKHFVFGPERSERSGSNDDRINMEASTSDRSRVIPLVENNNINK